MSREARTGRPSYARGLAWAGLLAMLAASLSGCSWICTWCASQQPAANRAPQIRALYAEQAGKRVRWVQPGSTVVVRAQTKDADGDALRYRWEAAPGSGRLLSGAGPTAVWDVGSSAGQKTLRLAVSDGRGGLARSDLGLAAGPKPVFSGQILSAAGGPVPLAAVEVNGQGAVADREGRFAIALEDANAERFLFNARKPGHGLVSSLHDHVVLDGRWVMTPATVQSIDPAVANLVRDLRSRENCQGPQSARVNWHLFPRQRVPRVLDGSGAPVAGVIPAQLREAVDFVLAGTECSPGISLQIPANALVGPQGTPPAGNVDVSVSTVDIFAPNGLPGDLTVQTKQGNRVMQSYGAGTLAASAGGQAYQLKPGAAATLTVPVDPAQLKRKAAIPPSIPLLLYNAGVWTEAGTARLNEAGDAYVGLVTHFSEYNMDLVKTDQSCVRVDASALPGSFEMDVVVPMGGAAPVVRHHAVSEDPAHPEPRLHALYNLPSNIWIGLIPMHEVGGTLVPYGIFGVNTGAPQVPTDPNRPAYPYDACRSEVTLTDVGGTVAAVVDGTASHAAPLPRHIYDLVDAGGTDIYPVGAGELYLFSLFDTGSNIVLIKDSDAALLNMGAASAGNANQDVDVRISGLNGVDPTTLGGTIYAPGGPGGAQAQVSGIRAGIRTLSESLIGTPVATQAVALIDYTRTVSRGPYGFCGGCMIDGPDITFYAPGDPAAPVPQLALQLERFGSAGTSGTDNATREQRYLLRNVAFRHGVNVANDDPAAPDPRYFSFDTGSRVVIISLDMAIALGIDTVADGILDCWSDAGHPGNEMYKVDSITITNPDGSYYQANNASVCVDKLDDKIVTTVSPGNKVDAVFGMNVFMQAPVIVNGPADTLGIGIAAP